MAVKELDATQNRLDVRRHVRRVVFCVVLPIGTSAINKTDVPPHVGTTPIFV